MPGSHSPLPPAAVEAAGIFNEVKIAQADSLVSSPEKFHLVRIPISPHPETVSRSPVGVMAVDRVQPAHSSCTSKFSTTPHVNNVAATLSCFVPGPSWA